MLRDAAELRGYVVRETVADVPIAAACLGAAVRALLLYDGYGFTGRAAVLWHARTVRAATATTAELADDSDSLGGIPAEEYAKGNYDLGYEDGTNDAGLEVDFGYPDTGPRLKKHR